MAIRNNPSRNGRQPVQRTNGDSARWTAGLILLFTGLYLTVAVLSYFFCWEQDQSVLQGVGSDSPRFVADVENLCGRSGAWVAEQVAGRGFGLFGVLLPVMVMLVGVRIVRKRPLLFNHSILSLCFVMILGSLSLGFLLGDRFGFCTSGGWGGALGVSMARLITDSIGPAGTIILLLTCWILTGVFVNRNFINTVNTAGNAMFDQGERFVELVRQRVTPRTGADEPAEGPAGEAAAADPAPQPAGTPPAEGSDPAGRGTRPDVGARPRVPEEPERQARPEGPEPGNPFLDGPAQAETPAAEPARPVEPSREAEEEFVEIDLATGGERPARPLTPLRRVTPAAARVVMGDDGIIELDMEPLLSDDEPEPEPRRTSLPETEGERPEFEEIDMSPAAGPGQAAERGGGTADAEPQEEPAPQEEGVVVTVETHEDASVDEASIPTGAYDPLKDLVNYRRPPVTLLEDYQSDSEVSDEEIYDNKSRIEQTLKDFGIPIQRIKATVGPTVTLYEIVQAQGVKISKIQGLENDIAQSLKALGIRIIAPIPGKGTIGIEVPNRSKQVVSMYSAVRSMKFQESKAELPVVIGRTIQNENYVFDLARMPHLLVAGATGQGKSVGLNAIITSLLYRKHPSQLKFVMIDPKMVEFSLYAKIERHFLARMESEEEAVITDPRKAVYTLNSLCTEMENRLALCKDAGARNIKEYNEKFTARRLNPLKGHRYLPYIVVVVDEFADLIMTAKEVEGPVMRLAQKARAVGIHLIIATQRPDVKVITGGIKANFPARIAFRVMQMIDSRTIIDRPGAEQLIGRGDMLFSNNGELTRIQCALVDTPEVERIVDYIAHEQGYTSPYALPDYAPEGDGGGLGSEEQASAPVKYDTLFAEIAREAVANGQISTSMIQRNYEVGFNRAGRIMMQLERAGIVGRQQGAKPRDILFHDSPSLEARLQELGVF